jgi:hypothetical protein
MSNNVITKRVKWEDMNSLPENPIQATRLARVEANGGFRPEFVGTIELAVNDMGAFPDLPEDAYVIVDGHHRKALWERANGNRGPDDTIAKIHRGLTRPEIEQRWLAVQDTRTHHVNETFVHRVAAGEAKAVHMNKIITEAGFRVPSYQPGAQVKDVIRGANSIEWVFDGGRRAGTKVYPKALIRTLEGLRVMYPGDTSATKSNLIKGLGAFHLRYGDAVDLERLHKRVPAKFPKADRVLGAAEDVNDALQFTVPNAVAWVVRLAYNGTRRTKADLPEWR